MSTPPLPAIAQADTAFRENIARMRQYLRENGTGFAASALLHLLLLVSILYLFSHRAEVVQTAGRVLSVDIVRLGEETQSPPAPRRAIVPQQASAPRGQSSSLSPAGTSKDTSKPIPQDAFDAKLRALAQLRQPDAKPVILNNTGSDAQTLSTDANGGHASYSLRDFVRAQVLRHWNLDYSILGERRFSVAIRVQMTSAGVIASAEIVDKQRYTADAIFHEIALSARNAVTLSSPIPLPPGSYRPLMNFVIDLDPRDTNR
jgi:hypothetical protein